MICELRIAPELGRRPEAELPKVLLVGPLPPPPLLGGIETGIELLLRTSLARTSSMTLFNTWRTPDPTRSIFQKLGYQIGVSWRFLAAVVNTQPAVVHVKAASGVNYYQNATYVLIARLARRRVLLQLHAGDFPQFYDRAGLLGQAIISASLRLPHRLIALSDSWATYFRDLSGGRDTGVVPNALVVAEFARVPPDRARFRIPASRTAVLFVGTRDPAFDVQKGLPELLEAMQLARRRRPELFLVMAGGPPDTAAISATLGAEGEAWTHVGTVSGESKIALFRAVDIFALPSRFENMPNTILEAMAAGRPVIATPVGAIPEMIEEGVNGFLVPVGDVTQLAARLEILSEDESLRSRMGNQAFDLATRRYDLSALERTLEGEYRRVYETRDESQQNTASNQAPPSRVAWFRRPSVQQRLRLVARLASMSPREIMHRISRLVSKQRERARVRASSTTPPRALPVSFSTGPVTYLTNRTTSQGFFAPTDRDSIAATARTHAGDDVARTVRDAESLLHDGVVLLGKRFHPAALDFDWLADPDHGRAWPLDVLDDTDAVRRVRADVKFVWEVNRHQFFVTLARAFAYTSDERYAEACITMARSWRAANPAGFGVNWASNLEVAIRLLAWMWTVQFLLGSRALSDGELRSWLSSIADHRDHLVANLSTFTDPTNHLIGEASALAVVTMWLPELPQSTDLRTLAVETLNRELIRQVADDGVDREQSLSYQRFVLDLTLQVIAAADANGIEIPDGIRQRAHAMVAATRSLVGESLRAPRIGDSDDARGIPFFREDLWDFSEILAVGAAVLGDPELSPTAPAEYESALWLAGLRALRTTPASPPARRSEVLGADYAILRPRRHTWADRLVFDCGPLGYLPHASHGHADLLSVLVDVEGEEILVDPSSFAYYDEQGRRDAFRATRAHNTVEIGNRDQADAFDPFKWLNIPRHGITIANVGPAFDYVEAWHDGYRRLRPAVRHRRAVLGLDGGWLLVDWLEGRGLHNVTRWFHAAPGSRLNRVDPRAIAIAAPNGNATLTISDVVGQATGASAIEETHAPYSERYGTSCDAPALRMSGTSTLPAMHVTLLSASTPERAGVKVDATSGSTECGALFLRLLEGDGNPIEIAIRTPNGPISAGPMKVSGRIVITTGSGSALHRLSSGDAV